MRSTLIIIVLVIKFIYCAHIGFGENDKPQNVEKNKDLERAETYKAILSNPDAFPIRKGSVGTTEKQIFVNLPNPYNQVTSSIKEKRCKWARSELYEKYVGNPKKFQKTSIKEMVGAKQRKRCETCRESVRCKTQGKCELCNRYCKDVDATTLPPPTSAPLLGSIQVYLEDENLATEQQPNEMSPFGKPGRYYTIGAFGPGPKQNLIVRLMNIAQKKSLDKLVVLAKPKGKVEDDNPEHPIIIDTANAFHAKDNSKKIHAEVHAVDRNTLQQAIDLDLTSKIDRELDMAVEEKRKNFGKSYLTSKEIDKIIDKVLSMVNSPHSGMVELGSRMNVGSTPHITTKRSVSDWPLNKNRDERTLNEPLVGSRFPDSELNEDSSPEFENPQTEDNNSKLNSNTRTTKSKSQDQFLNNIVGAPKAGNNYKSDSYLVEDDCAEAVDQRNTVDDADDSSEIGEDLLEYEPAPPTYLDYNMNQPAYVEKGLKNLDQNYSSPVPPSVPERQTQQKASNVLSVPVSNNQKLESASQYLDPANPQNDLPENIPVEEMDLPPTEEYHGQDDDTEVFGDNEMKNEDVIVTLTQAPETYDENGNGSDPIVGNWISDELEDAKHWWRTNVGMKTPPNLADNVIDSPRMIENQTDDGFQVAESKRNLINASHFTLILKNLEQKVENIADLVKRTCGKLNPGEENVGEEQPAFMQPHREEQPVPQSSDTKARAEPARARNQIQVIDVPENDTADFEAITTYMEVDNITADPPGNRPPHVLDTAMQGLHESTNFLINKAVNIADQLQDGAFSPKRTENKPLLQAIQHDTVGAANMNRKLFTVDDIPVGCSKEDSGEYLGESRTSSKQDPTVACSKEDSGEYVGDKLKNKKDAIQLRSGFAPEVSTTPAKGKSEDNVACSKEDSGEYLGVKLQNQPEEEDIPNEKQQTQPEKQQGQIKLLQDTPKISATESPKSDDIENVACSKESDEYVGKSAQEEEDASETPLKPNRLNVIFPKSLRSDIKNMKQEEAQEEEGASEAPRKVNRLNVILPESLRSDIKNIKQDIDHADSQIIKQEIPETPQKDEEVGCSKEKSEEYVGDQKKEILEPATAGNEEAVGCSKEEDEYMVPVYPAYGSNSYRESNSKPKSNSASSDLPKFKLPHIPALDNLFHHNPLPQHNREGSLPSPFRKASKITLPSVLNRNRDHNIPAAAHLSNTPQVFNSDPEEHFGDIPSDSQKFVAEPDSSESAQNIDQPRRPIISPINTHSAKQGTKIPDSDGSVAFRDEPSQHQQPDAGSPLNEDIRIVPASTPVRQHANEVFPPPALNQRFGEQSRVGPDGFHLHRPQLLQDWPRLQSKDDVLGAEKDADPKDDAASQTSTTVNSQNPFSIFGKVVPQLNNTEVSFHHIPSNKIYFLGTGMQLPLNMKKDEDGTYQLSVDIDKLCNNCKGSPCNKKSKKEEADATIKQNQTREDDDDVPLGLQAPPSSEEIPQDDNTTESNPKRPSEVENHPELRNEKEIQLDDASSKRKNPQKIEIVAMEVPNSRNRRVSNSRRISQETQSPTEPQLFEAENRQEVRIPRKFKYQPLFDMGPNSERKHSKRSPSLDLGFSSIKKDDTVKRSVDGRKSEIASRNSIDLDSLDESLKKIDDNMKRYFNRRQKLDDFYKDEVRRNLEEPDDVVKRRVTLVNNVLAWMKSIAVQNPRT